MMVNWKFAWREVRMRPSRAILTLLSIVIGVAAVVAVTIASGTTRHAFNQIYQDGRREGVARSFAEQSAAASMKKLPTKYATFRAFKRLLRC